MRFGLSSGTKGAKGVVVFSPLINCDICAFLVCVLCGFLHCFNDAASPEDFRIRLSSVCVSCGALCQLSMM